MFCVLIHHKASRVHVRKVFLHVSSGMLALSHKNSDDNVSDVLQFSFHLSVANLVSKYLFQPELV